MRQAGRSLPRYRELRRKRSIAELLCDPAAVAEITLLPLEHYPVDAAILFMDLSTPFGGAGWQVQFREGVGPRVDRPLSTGTDLRRLHPFDPTRALDFVFEAIRLVKPHLDVPLIGFVGAPFTICSYLFEGDRARRLQSAKRWLWAESEAWDELADYWSEHLAAFAIAQYRAGADLIQVFDSWVGTLGRKDYERHVLPYTRRLFERLEAAGVPSIHFGTGNPSLLDLMVRAGGDAIGVDWRVSLDEAWRIIGHGRAIQGNLDPAALLAGVDTATRLTREILDEAGGRPGHIFNLGHGIPPEASPEVIRAVVDVVHTHRLPGRSAAGNDPS